MSVFEVLHKQRPFCEQETAGVNSGGRRPRAVMLNELDIRPEPHNKDPASIGRYPIVQHRYLNLGLLIRLKVIDVVTYIGMFGHGVTAPRLVRCTYRLVPPEACCRGHSRS